MSLDFGAAEGWFTEAINIEPENPDMINELAFFLINNNHDC